MGRERMSIMIGEKIIGKIFLDNIKDFSSGDEKDMEPILHICNVITKVLAILKELDAKQRAMIESQVLYRSNIMQILFKYISSRYTVQKFDMGRITENDPLFRRF